MNFIKRGKASLLRNVGKTLILLGLIFLLGAIVAGAFVMNQAVNHTTHQMSLSLPTVATLRPIEGGTERITSEMVQEIGALSHVRMFDYSIQWSAFSRLLYVRPESEIEGDSTFTFPWEGINSFFWLNGVSMTEPIYIQEGLFELYNGRLFTETEMMPLESNHPTPILIPRDVAELNHLSVGDIVSLYCSRFTPPTGARIPDEGFIDLSHPEIETHPYNVVTPLAFEFEVIGLLDIDYYPALHSESLYIQQVVYNSFLLPNWKTEYMMMAFFENQLQWSAVFNPKISESDQNWINNVIAFWIVEYPLDMADFKAAANEILPVSYIIEDWHQVFNPLQHTITTVSRIATNTLLFAICATILLLSLLLMLYLRDRHHELGVYLALGERKIKIIFQIIMEVATVAIIGLGLAILAGPFISTRISHEFIMSELVESLSTYDEPILVWNEALGDWEAIFEYPSQIEFFGMGRDFTPDELIDFFTVSLNFSTTLMFYGIGLATVMISTIVPLIYLLELKPKDVLIGGKIE